MRSALCGAIVWSPKRLEAEGGAAMKAIADVDDRWRRLRGVRALRGLRVGLLFVHATQRRAHLVERALLE